MKYTKIFKISLMLAVFVLPLQAQALMISPNDAFDDGSGLYDDATTYFPYSSQNNITAYLTATYGDIFESELYKADTDPFEESGPYSSSYDTVFSNSSSDPQDADISYEGGPVISSDPTFLLVKDGNVSPYWYLFNLTNLGWDGMTTLELENFWPGNGAISHVSIYGDAAPVPEPATMLLFGTGLAGVAAMRRRTKK